MKVLVICTDHSTFEFLSVFKYPYWDPSADDDKRYQIRISHGTVFCQSKQDYTIYKCRTAIQRDRVHELLNKQVLNLVAESWDKNIMGCIIMKGIIEEALNEE